MELFKEIKGTQAFVHFGNSPLELDYSTDISSLGLIDQLNVINSILPILIGKGFVDPVSGDQALAKMATEAWENVANIEFTINDSSPDIGIYKAFSGNDALFGTTFSYLQDPDIFINNNLAAIAHHDVSFTYIHELGHALDLKHPSIVTGSHDILNVGLTVMSNNSHFVQIANGKNGTIPLIDELPVTPMILDIQAIQELYGVNTTTNIGNTTYTISEDKSVNITDSVNGDNAVSGGLMTVWDASKNNSAIDEFRVADGITTNTQIDLRAGFLTEEDVSADLEDIYAFTTYTESFGVQPTQYFTKVGDTTIFNAFENAGRGIIENATGGGGNDHIYGNAADNVLKGKNGSDTIYGNGGNDTLDGGSGKDTLIGGDGLDTYRFSSSAEWIDDIIDDDNGILVIGNTVINANLIQENDGTHNRIVELAGETYNWALDKNNNLHITQGTKSHLVINDFQSGDYGLTISSGQDDIAQTTINTPVLVDVLANDLHIGSPFDFSTLQTRNESNLTTAIDRTTGEILVTPDTGFADTASFSYSIKDERGNETSADVLVDVSDPDDPEDPNSLDDTPFAHDDDPVGSKYITQSFSGSFSEVDGRTSYAEMPVKWGASPLWTHSFKLSEFDPNQFNTNNGARILLEIRLDQKVSYDLSAEMSDLISQGSSRLGDNAQTITNNKSLSFFMGSSFFPEIPAKVPQYDFPLTKYYSDGITDIDIVWSPTKGRKIGLSGNEDSIPYRSIALNNKFIGDGTYDFAVIAVSSFSGSIHRSGGGGFDFHSRSGPDTWSSDFSHTSRITYVYVDNEAPLAVDDTVEVTEIGGSISIGVLANDKDPDIYTEIDARTLNIESTPSNGSLAINNGTITYTPNTNYAGTETFTYTVADTNDLRSNVATVTINVADIVDNTYEGNEEDNDLSIITTTSIVLKGNGGDDILISGDGADQLIGGPGNDQTNGGQGNDTYIFAAGDGFDTITDTGGIDILKIEGDITLSDLTFTKDGNNLVIDIASGVTIIDQFSVDPDNVVEFLSFDDGSVVDLLNIELPSNTNEILGTTGRDILTGTPVNDVISSLSGSVDRMSGGAGADIFVIGAEANNGARERDIILDYEVGVDSILLEDDATVGSIRQTTSGVTVFLEGDRDAIFVQGDGVLVGNLTFIPEDILLA